MLNIYYLRSKNVVLVMSVLILMIYIVRAESSQVILSVEEIKDLIPKIEAAEKRLLNVKIESDVWMEESASSSGPWEKTPVKVTATSWFDGIPKGKGRVDVHSEISKLHEEDSNSYSYTEQSYTACYDGKFGRIIYYKYGNVEKTLNVKRGKVLNAAPGILNGRTNGSVTGLKFTTNYFFVDKEDRESFSQYFKISISPEALKMNSFEVVREEHDGIQCIRFSLKGSKSVRMNWWFDPSRGFALLEYETIMKNKEGVEGVAERIKVNKLKKVSDDIWWPVEGTIESDKHKPQDPYSRTVYQASNVVVNDPNFDESVFTVSFPDGYKVEDKVTGKTYIVDANSK